MATLFPSMIATVGDVAYNYGWLLQWPIAWHSIAPDWNQENLTSIDGRFMKNNGELHGTASIKRQATFISSGTGRKFTVVSGTWRDGISDPQYDAPGIYQIDGGQSAPQAEVVSATQTTGMEHALLLLHRDFVSVNAGNARTKTGYYAYLHLAYNSPDGLDYRIALEWGQPVRVDFTRDFGKTWTQVSLASNLGDSNGYLKSHRQEFRVKVQPDKENVRLEMEFGDGNFLRTAEGPMPQKGNIRLVTKGGSVRFWYYPLRYQPINLFKSPKDFQTPLQNLDKGVIAVNGRTNAAKDQQVQYSISSPDGQKLTVQLKAQRPDAGDTLGSDTPPKLSDFTVYVPPIYVNASPGNIPDARISQLRVMRVEQLDIFDPVSRQASFAANLICSNQGGFYNGSYGRYAMTLDSSNGGQWYRQCTGIAGDGEGIRFWRQDPVNLMFVPLVDKSAMMQRALGQEVDFDGWAWPAVARFLANAGNIADDFLTSIPYWPPGIADESCPFYTLPRGSGNTPRFRFYPTQSCWSILNEIAMQLSVVDPATGLPIPFYMGFDEFGQFHFEPVSFISKPDRAFYSQRPADTGGVPIEQMEIFNSVAEMRSSLDFFGLDAQSFEALYLHVPMSPAVLKAVGYTMPLVQRSPTFISADYMSYVAQAVQYQASLVQQTMRIKAPFIPEVRAGAVVQVWAEELGGLGRYVAERIMSCYGIQDVSGRSGFNDCYSILDLRSITNTI